MAKRPKAEATLARARKHPTLPVKASDPRIQKLGARFVEARGQVFEYLVDRGRELGVVLEEAEKLLADPVAYNRWTASLDISRTSARNFTNTARLAREAPGAFERWRGLGPAKIYRVARLAPRARTKILGTPGIQAMTDAQFSELCAPWIEKRVPVTVNMLGNGLVQKAAGMNGKLAKWELPLIESSTVKARLKQSLLEIAKRARELAAQL